ncbi:MAG TPA: DegT/DnrJ/EryC1/StrS family aminotransferase [bacterium]|nr:DegT/DnrJ/EryC1/StrS family aminotransferase [bacterium]HOL66316.1 DegT/DnrJ/EryC1/StrS family aminotransferase [bacterium]HPP11254.1 DegT/DnrJ/EryC1/StrS family aminotransferase [bacterium]
MNKLALFGGKPVRKSFPQNWPEFGQDEEESLREVVRSGKWWMYSYVPETLSRVAKFERKFARFQRVKHCLAVSSGSAALEICVRALGIKPGDEVITTPYTFIATVSCLLNHYAFPVFVDIDPATYQIDPRRVEAAITERTKAIIPVHFGGNMADMDSLMLLARKYNLKVIEDAAQAHSACYHDGRSAGGIGDMGIFSFQWSKNLTCGEGGAVTTSDERLADLAWSLRHYGRERNGIWYQHYRSGWNLRMSEFQAAVLLTQLKRLKSQTLRRMRNYRLVMKLLDGLPGVKPMALNPAQKVFPHHLVIFRYFPEEWGNVPLEKFLKALEAEGIPAGPGYPIPLYRQPVFRNLDFSRTSPFMIGRKKPVNYQECADSCPNAEAACAGHTIWLAGRLLLFEPKDIRTVAEAFWKLWENRAHLLEQNKPSR